MTDRHSAAAAPCSTCPPRTRRRWRNRRRWPPTSWSSTWKTRSAPAEKIAARERLRAASNGRAASAPKSSSASMRCRANGAPTICAAARAVPARRHPAAEGRDAARYPGSQRRAGRGAIRTVALWAMIETPTRHAQSRRHRRARSRPRRAADGAGRRHQRSRQGDRHRGDRQTGAI